GLSLTLRNEPRAKPSDFGYFSPSLRRTGIDADPAGGGSARGRSQVGHKPRPVARAGPPFRPPRPSHPEKRQVAEIASPADAPDRPSGVPQGVMCGQLAGNPPPNRRWRGSCQRWFSSGAEAPLLNRGRQGPGPGRQAKPRRRFGKPRPPNGQPTGGILRSARPGEAPLEG